METGCSRLRFQFEFPGSDRHWLCRGTRGSVRARDVDPDRHRRLRGGVQGESLV